MKKTLLSVLMLSALGTLTINAQITITEANIAAVGDNVEQATDTLPTGVSMGTPGANQTWDFSTLAADELDTLMFRAPAGYPGADQFPNSNMALVTSSADSTWSYLLKNSTDLKTQGIALYLQGNFVTIPITQTIIKFPATMNDGYAETWNGLLLGISRPELTLMGLDSLKITRGSSTNSTIDAWGDVTTPLGTFETIRQNIYEESIDTTWEKSLLTGNWTVISQGTITTLAGAGIPLTQYAYDTTRTVRWWSDNADAKFPVVEMDYEANGTINTAKWLKTPVYVGVSELSKNNTIISYPNPASTTITIESFLTNNHSIAILDVTGKLVKETKFTSNKLTISITDLDNGIYFYNIYDVNGNITNGNKFVVTK